MYALEACQCEVFSTAYALRRTTQGASYFVPQSRVEKIIVNMVDHDMRDTMVWVTGLWEAELENEGGAIPVFLNLGSAPHGGALLTVNIEAKLWNLTTIKYDCRN